MRLFTAFWTGLFLICSFASGQTFEPIAVTGFNEDVVAEAGTSSLLTTTSEMDAVPISNFVLCSKAFAESNGFTPANTYGLPDDGVLSTTTRSYQMAPYDAANVLYLFANDTASLTLSAPSRFTDLSLLTLSTEGDSQLQITFHFTDGTSQTENRNVLDWFGPVLNPEFSGYGRVKRIDGPFINGVDYQAAQEGNPKFFPMDFLLPCTKTLNRISFKNTSASGGGSFRAFVLAVSGKERKVIPNVTITASDTSVCQGTAISFTASPDSQGTAPTYVWKINDSIVGTNSTLYSSTGFRNQQKITCTLTSSSVCASPKTVVSNPIRVTILPKLTPEGILTVDDSTVCAGTPVSFQVATLNAGSPPTYSWRLNGQLAGDDSSRFTLTNPKTGDKIFCLVFSTEACRTQNSVRTATIQLDVTPVYVISIQAPDTVLLDDTARTIVVSPDGGILTGNGISGMKFQPSVAGKGDHTITYSFPDNDCTEPGSRSIYVKEENFPCSLEPTTLITQNGDGLNDTWNVGDFNKKCIQVAGVEIFNRWGVSVYQSDKYQNDWKPTDLIPGCYFFTVRYTRFGAAGDMVKSGVLSVVQ
ncbi:MAG TPA: gliding motility-associated C-terminal domain-containing protein [Catalimonadaceae bacterium]|nr:gliding motility-associated C-terminal domain-containing protein [Catalimonadaceae bacterium]